MAIKVKVRQSQLKTNTTKVRPSATYFVDDSLTVGLKNAKFITVKPDGTADGNVEATLTYAGAAAKTYDAGVLAAGAIVVPQKKALGIQYESTKKDPLGRKDDLTDNENLLPKGRLQDWRIGFITEGILDITDTTQAEGRYFRTTNDLLGTPSAQDATAKTITMTGDLTARVRAGDNVLNNGVTTQVVSAVYTSPSTVITTLAGGYGDIAKPTTVLSQIGEIGYLADDMTGDLPFTFVVPTSGKIKQPVGIVESATTFRVAIDPMNAAIV